jgi:hypothetical protein
MNLNNYKVLLITITTIIALSVFYSLPSNIFPNQKEESFFSLAILGENGKANDYFPTDEPIIFLNTPARWHVYLYNKMGEAQQVKIKVKLSDSKTLPPNSTTCTPSSAIEIFEFRRVLRDNDNITIPLEWKIIDISENEESDSVLIININNYLTPLNFEVFEDEKIKMIFELWVYDVMLHDFKFEWSDLGETRCIWNQITFHISR